METHKLEERLKKNDLRLTEARRLVFEIFKKSNKALTPKDIHKALGSQTDLASIYRNLTLFKDIGLIHSLSEGSYSLCQHEYDENEKHKHIHIIVSCNQCGRTEEIKEHAHGLCKASNALAKFSAPLSKINSIVLQGTCQNCC